MLTCCCVGLLQKLSRRVAQPVLPVKFVTLNKRQLLRARACRISMGGERSRWWVLKV